MASSFTGSGGTIDGSATGSGGAGRLVDAPPAVDGGGAGRRIGVVFLWHPVVPPVSTVSTVNTVRSGHVVVEAAGRALDNFPVINVINVVNVMSGMIFMIVII
jgi:hypothetical protein